MQLECIANLSSFLVEGFAEVRRCNLQPIERCVIGYAKNQRVKPKVFKQNPHTWIRVHLHTVRKSQDCCDTLLFL